MKTSQIAILGVVCMTCILQLTSCKKGVDDPLLSLRSRKARLIGNWELIDFTYNSFDGHEFRPLNYSYQGSFKDGIVTVKERSQIDNVFHDTTYQYPYSYHIHIRKDGTYWYREKEGSVTLEQQGTWIWESSAKRKSEITLRSDWQQTPNGHRSYHVQELRNKKLVLAGNWNWIYTDSRGYADTRIHQAIYTFENLGK